MMTLSDIRAVMAGRDLKPGYTVNYTESRHGDVQIEARDESGSLVWRKWNCESDFDSELLRNVEYFSTPKAQADIERADAEKQAHALRCDAMFYMSAGEMPLMSDFTDEQILAEVELMNSEEIGVTAAAILRTAQMLQSPEQILAVELDMNEVVMFQENGLDVLRHACKDDTEAMAIFAALERIMDGSHPNAAALLYDEAHAINYVVDAVAEGAAHLDGFIVVRNGAEYLKEWNVPSVYTLNPLRAAWYSEGDKERGYIKQFCRTGDVIEPLSDAIKRVYAMACKAA